MAASLSATFSTTAVAADEDDSSRGYQAASFALAGRAVATASGRRSLKMVDFIYEYGLVMTIVTV